MNFHNPVNPEKSLSSSYFNDGTPKVAFDYSRLTALELASNHGIYGQSFGTDNGGGVLLVKRNYGQTVVPSWYEHLVNTRIICIESSKHPIQLSPVVRPLFVLFKRQIEEVGVLGIYPFIVFPSEPNSLMVFLSRLKHQDLISNAFGLVVVDFALKRNNVVNANAAD